MQPYQTLPPGLGQLLDRPSGKLSLSKRVSASSWAACLTIGLGRAVACAASLAGCQQEGLLGIGVGEGCGLCCQPGRLLRSCSGRRQCEKTGGRPARAVL